MVHQKIDIVRFPRIVLRGLIWLNLAVGLGIVALFIASFVAETQVLIGLGARAEAHPALLVGMRVIMVIGILGTPLTHVLLSRLVAIVETVRAGDPFVPENADHLRTIAWVLLGLQVLHLAAGALSASASRGVDTLDIEWNFSVTGWLGVLLLFVLARVFRFGTSMREDLEGTV